MTKFAVGEFALLQGQIVEIISVRLRTTLDCDYYEYKIKLLNDNLTHWILEPDLGSLSNQNTPKVLFSNAKSST